MYWPRARSRDTLRGDWRACDDRPDIGRTAWAGRETEESGFMAQSSLELFRQACGAAGSLGLEVEHYAKPGISRRLLECPFAIVGREAGADLPLPDHWVSPRHAYLQVIGGRVVAIDLGSRTGMRWANGPRRVGWLSTEEMVRIGPYFLRLQRSEGGAGGTLNALPALGPERGAGVEFECVGGGRAVRWEMKSAVALVGRSSRCGVILRDESVSGVHCSLVRTGQTVWAVDLLGRGGIVVNGERVRFAQLEDGDELGVGTFGLRCRYPAPPALQSSPLPPHGAPAGPPSPAALSSTGGGPALPSSVGAEVAAALLPLLTQFAGIQQQMFDEFRSTMVEAMQAIGAWQAGHLDRVQSELQHLHQTTREIQQLQQEMARDGPLALASEVGSAVDTGVAGARLLPPAPTTRGAEPTDLPGVAETAAVGRTPGQHTSPRETGQARYASWCQRVAALEQERESTWKCIVGFLTGKA